MDAFDTTLRAYEAIRTSLVRDRLAGVKGSAAQIAKGAGDLAKAYEPATARTPGRSSEEMVPILTAVSSAAREVAAAADIESARKAFSSLSDAMIRWRSVATGTKPVVVYCSMAERWWIQPDERIGNPYYGQSMATCGQVIDR